MRAVSDFLLPPLSLLSLLSPYRPIIITLEPTFFSILNGNITFMIRFWELQTNYFLVTSNFLPSNQISSFLAARILLLWFSPETIFVVAKFTTNVANHGNLISRCCCCADFGKKETHIPFIHNLTFLFRTIPTQGNTAEIVLNVLHRNFLGVDEFLGMVSMPLRDFDVYERPKTK